MSDNTNVKVDELLAKVPTGLLINGEWVDASDGSTFDVENPATGEVIATLASATSEDAKKAMDAACACLLYTSPSPRDRG